MSFLAPFYLLAGLAVSLPILFHLIRRTPRGRQVFGSTIFLRSSPPRMTQRSRIEDWLLLVLRGLALCLLALVFARPFLRAQESAPPPPATGQHLLILLDTSASMQRLGLWSQAITETNRLIEQAQTADRLAVFTFDSEVHEVWTFEDNDGMSQEVRRVEVANRLKEFQPGWRNTKLGDALMTAVERMQEVSTAGESFKRIVLISDMQAGSDWQNLSSFPWPDDVVVEAIPLEEEASRTNAWVQPSLEQQRNRNEIRLRVSNSENAERELFHLVWKDEFGGQEAPSQVSVSVPPGQSRTVRMEYPEGKSAHHLVLTGDDAVFDNDCYVVPTRMTEKVIVFLSAAEDDGTAQHLRFFVEPMFPPTASRRVRVIDWQRNQTRPEVTDHEISLLLLTGEMSREQIRWAREWMQSGGTALFVARDPDQATAFYDLLAVPPVRVEEAEVDRYALLQNVDLRHPLLRPFDDPRYSDFTKLRFWKYRRYAEESLPGLKRLAEFEDGSVALGEFEVDQGKLMLLASSWSRQDSELAVWSKFVPLMNGILEEASGSGVLQRQKTVGETVSLSDLGWETETITVRFRGETFTIGATEFLPLDQPGIYELAPAHQPDERQRAAVIAANLDTNESRIEPLDLQALSAAGVRLKLEEKKGVKLTAAEQRQLMSKELESRQQIWRWLLVATLLVLLLETIWAASRTLNQRVQTP